MVALAVVAGSAVIGLLWVSNEGDTDLRDEGVTTVGTIVRVDSDGRWDPGGAQVRFTAGAETDVRYASLGAWADDYVEGQAVVVVYDLSDPRRFTIDDAVYEPSWMTWATGISGAVAAVAGVAGASWVRTHRRTRRLLRTRAWTAVRVRVLPDQDSLCFTTPDGVSWDGGASSDWPEPNREPRELSGWGLPDEDPAEVPFDQAAWWVSDGTTAVFSPDQGPPLVAARRRP